MFRTIVVVAMLSLAAMPAGGQAQPSTTPPATATVSSPATASAAPALPAATSQSACRKEITIYIDLSGTMTTRSPNQSNPNRVPLNDIADTLRKFVDNDEFIKAGDTVSVKYFGTIVKSQAESREQASALLAQLADPGQWRTVISGVTRSDFQQLTDFGKLLSDIRDRIANANTQRQIIFVASDFAHDQMNGDCKPSSVSPRIEDFLGALNTYRPAITESMDPHGLQFGRVQIAGIYAPEANCPGNRDVARRVRDELNDVGIRFYRYDEDATEAARTLRNYFAGTVTARAAGEIGVLVGGDHRVRFTVSNPNCDAVQVIGLSIQSDTLTKSIAITPTAVGLGNTDVSVSYDDLAVLWGQEVVVTPVLQAGSSARTAGSPRFWLGDWVRVTGLSPFLYPWWNEDSGSTIVKGSIHQSLQRTGSITIRGIEPGSRGRTFTLPAGSGERDVVFLFALDREQLRTLIGPSPTVRFEGDGLRLMDDDHVAMQQLDLPLAASVVSRTGDVIAIAVIVSWILIWILFLWISVRTFSQQSDATLVDQSTFFLRRIRGLGWPLVFTAILTKWGPFHALSTSPLWLLIVIRAFALAVSAYFLLRVFLVEAGWKWFFEHQLIPSDRAVARRRFANGFICTAALILVGYVFYTFAWQPQTSPPKFSEVLSGVLR